MNEPLAIADEVQVECTRMTSTNALRALIGGMVAAGVLAAALWRGVPHGRVLLWLGITLAVYVVHAATLLRWRARHRAGAQPRWTRWRTLDSALLGLGWGSAALIAPLGAGHLPESAMVAATLCAVTSGVAITTSTLRIAFRSFLLAAWIPAIVAFLSAGPRLTTLIGLGGALYVVMLSFVQWLACRDLQAAVRSRIDAQALARELANAQTHQLGVNVQLKRAHDEVERLAFSDQLTGLANRRQFLERLAPCLADARGSTCVLLIDADHFKSINDTRGHSVGDSALVAIADALRSTIRERDLAARLGGEEFAVLAPATTFKHALVLAERVRAAIAAAPVEGQPGLALTVSIGVAQAAPTAKPDQVLRSADHALYAAKGNGRNRVEAAGPVARGAA